MFLSAGWEGLCEAHKQGHAGNISEAKLSNLSRGSRGIGTAAPRQQNAH